MGGLVLTVGEGLGVLQPSGGGSLEAGDASVSTGGAEGNVAVGLARLGTPVRWAGRVGRDGIGRRVTGSLRREGVEVVAFEDAQAPTAFLVKESPAPGRTVVSYYRTACAGSRLSVDDVASLPLDDVAVVHVTGITLALSDSASAAIDALVQRARDNGALVSFDVNHRARLWGERDASAAYRRLAARSDIVFAGDDEAALLVGGTPEQMLEGIAAWGASEVVLKRGVQGALALIDGDLHRRAAVAVDVVDTVGAGDAFVAGYLAERLRGADAQSRLRLATLCGAAACRAPGDWEGAATRDEAVTIERAAAGRSPAQDDSGDPVIR